MVTFTLSQSVWEFANRVPYVPCMPVQSTCKLAKRLATSHIDVPIRQTTCQHAKGVPIFQLGVANVPKVMPFQTVLLQNAKGNFHTLLLYKKFYILLDIIAIHTICICIVHKNYVVLHFYTSCRITVCGIFVF